MLYLRHILFALYAVALLSLIVRLLLDNRQPAKTMAWLLVLVFLPVVGMVLYFFFGRNTRREKLISRQSLDQLTRRTMLEFAEQENLHLPENYLPLMKLFGNQDGALPFKDNKVDIYTSGQEYFTALLDEIRRAVHHIHILVFIIDDDPLGRSIADALITKAQEGVEVRFIFDAVGSWHTPSAFFSRMQRAGVEVHPFMPVHFPAFTSKMNHRNHRKLCVIDGRVGFIGGMNMAERYVRGTTRQPWRDTHLRVRGGAVYAIQRAFLVDWYFVSHTLITDRRYYPDIDAGISNNCIAQVVTSSPISPWADIMQGYVHILIEAHNYVYMESPYFIPPAPVLFALRTAALSGIDVRLMIPFRCDSRLAGWATRSYLPQVMEAGVQVYLYRPAFNHTKMLVCDDALCTCGSTNIDFRSFENDFEANIFFFDRALALRMKQVFLSDQEHCLLLNEHKHIRHPFLQRLWESVVRLLSPLM